MQNTIQEEFEAHLKTIQDVIKKSGNDLEHAAEIVINALKNGHKVILFGNGGSAADAQHIAAELSGRYKTERRGLPGLALTTDTSALTAIGNDFGYDKVFERQVESLAQEGDVLIGISTSGNSKNVINAFKIGQEIGCKIIGMTGRDGGDMNNHCEVNIIVPSNDTPRIQEMHILFGHTLCQLIDNAYEGE